MVVTDYNEQFLDKRGTDHLIDELKAYADSIATGSVDLSDYVTKSELQAKLDALHINIDLSSYATKEELTQAINSIDLSSYALKTEIPSIDGLATTEYVDNAVSNIPTTDLSNYYTKAETYSKTEVDTLVANSGGSSSGGTTEPTTPEPTPTPEPEPTPTHNVTIESSTNTIRVGGSYKSLTAKVTDANGNDVTSDYSNATFDWTCSIDGNDYTNNCTWRAGTEFNQKKLKMSTDESYAGKNMVVKVVIGNSTSGSATITGTTTLEIVAS